MSTELQQLDVVVATFQPKRLDTLKDHLRPHIGYRGKWEVYWIIEEGVYEGQAALWPWEGSAFEAPFHAWVPEEDLVDVELLEVCR